MNPELWDLVIVGAGPAGLSTVAECLYHKCGKAIILEKGESHNQTIRQYYPEDKRVDAAYLGQEAICAGVLCFRDTTKQNFLKVAQTLIRVYHPNIRYNVQVDSIQKRQDNLFDVFTSNQECFRARRVVVAIGRMGKPNRPDYFGSVPPKVRVHLHFDLRKIPQDRKKILVVGGGNTAIEFALSLISKHDVTVSYRQETFSRLNPMNSALLQKAEAQNQIRVLRSSNIQEIQEMGEGRPLVLFAEREKEVFDEVVYGIGGSSPVAFLQNAHLSLNAQGNPLLNASLESSVPDLFVAGELSVPPGKGSIIVSFNSGKKIIETIMERAGIPRSPELNLVTG